MKKSLQLQSLQQDLPLSHFAGHDAQAAEQKITMDIILMTLNHTAITYTIDAR